MKGQDYTVNHRHLSLPEGLSHQQVNCFLQDQNGLIWIGTHYGLNRFDGHHFDVWTGMKDSLASSQIHFLMEDQLGWIWVISTLDPFVKSEVQAISLIHSTSGAVQRLPQDLEVQLPFQLDEIEHFFSAPDHTVYFLADGILWKYDSSGAFTKQEHPSQVKPLLAIDSSNFYGTTTDGIIQFDSKGRQVRKMAYGQSGKVETLLGDKQGVWLKALGNPLTYFPKEVETSVVQTESYGGKRKGCFFDTQRGWLWTCNLFNIVAFDRKGEKMFDFEEMLGKEFKAHITSIFVDREGLVWMGTRLGLYLMEVKPNRFRRYLFRYGDTRDVASMKYQCRGILEQGGQLFVNTYQGSVKIDLKSGQVEELSRPKHFKYTKRHFLFCKRDNGTILSLSNHLSKMDGVTGEIIEHQEIEGNEWPIWGVHEDQRGTLWLSTPSGLMMYKDKRVHTFRAYNGFTSLENSQVYWFLEEGDDQLWLGSESGLYLLDLQEGVVDHYWAGGQNEHYLPGTQIQHIMKDAEGFFWMATEHEGLIKWHPETKELKHLTREDGLPTNTIYAVYEDQQGFLWMSSDFGLIQMDKQTFRKKIYMPEDGIGYSEFNRTSHFQASDGQIFFGGQNGVTAFDPRDFWESWYQNEQLALQVHQFTEGHQFGALKVDALDRLEQKDLLSYSHDVRTLSFRIKAPSFFLANKIDYYYNMTTLGRADYNSPFSGEWIKSEGNTINILGMVPGQHRLTIEARGLDREAIGRPIEYEIFMRQPFFRTWIFWAGLVGIGVLGLFIYFQLRTRRMRRQQQILEQKVKERTQEILKGQQIIHRQAKQIEQLDSLLNKADEKWAQELEEVVKDNLGNFNLNIADIAVEMNLSRTHFFRKIKTVTGFTPNQYLKEARLNEAKRMLESGECDTVKAVSLSVGFKKSSYFSTQFKERFGYSPNQYINPN